MKDYTKDFQEKSLLNRKVLLADNLNSIFNQEDINKIIDIYGNLNNFIDKSLRSSNFYEDNKVMFQSCSICVNYENCKQNKHYRCKDVTCPVQFDDRYKLIGDKNILSWFIMHTIIYLNTYKDSSRFLGTFYTIFIENIEQIKLKGNQITFYSNHFHHYERVKNSTMLSYQGADIETLLVKIAHFITGKHFEFYFDNITNVNESRSPIEEIMFKALDNHKYLRRKYKFTLDRQSVINDEFGNVLFTLDMLLNVNNQFKLCIECDGYNYHSDPERFEMDRLRDRTLLKKGIVTARFSSYDINYRLEDSIQDIIDIVEYNIHKIR